jgi:hypothetical protein
MPKIETMDRIIIVAKEALDHLDKLLSADDVKVQTIKQGFQSAIAGLDTMLAQALAEEHRVTGLWRATEKRTSPCNCAKCVPEEMDARITSVREALAEETQEQEREPQFE